MTKFPIGIIYILRDKFQIYIPNFSSILEFRFLPEFIRDLDVYNKELLFNLLDLFIKNNKIPPTSFVIVIADSASIIKDFLTTPQPNLEEAKKQADEFLEHIPFEEVASKKILIRNGIRAYAANKDLYEVMREFLTHVGSEVIYVLPGTIIGPELHPSLDANGINAILKKYPTLKEYNLTTQPVLHLTTNKKEDKEEKEIEAEISEIAEGAKNEKKSDKKKMIILVAVFVILLGVLVFVYLTQPSV